MGNALPSSEVAQGLKPWLLKKKLLFAGGRWLDSKESFTTVNPATEEVLAEVALASKEDVERAVGAARLAFETGGWSQKALRDRAAVVRRLGDLVLEHRAELAVLESLDTGKPIGESFDGDILRAAHNFHFFADYALQCDGLYFDNGTETHRAFREPLGVVALITPWNLPLYLETWKLAPALLMGNSVVLKPSELTPLTATYFAELAQKAGLPDGVLNVVHGFGEASTGEFLTSHPEVDAISFTGETSTGRAILRSAAVGPTRVSFELGGKGAFVVFEDAPLEVAATEAVRAGFRNQGEICLATPRLYIHRRCYDAFKDIFLKKVGEIVVGNPLDPTTTMGALISEGHLRKVTGYVKEAQSEGVILTGGERPSHCPRGYFLLPTVIEGLKDAHPAACEEIFGPVVTLHPFDSEAEVTQRVNATPYGLSSSVWTRDLDRAQRVARAIRTGLVWVNSWFVRDLRVPFGGQKRSGIGREGGKFSLDFFSEWKSVCVRALP